MSASAFRRVSAHRYSRRTMNARDRDPIRLTPASTYARFAPFVQRRLAGLGVRDADLPDLCQEVFLVVHGKGQQLPAVGRIDLWLREICRRVAAGYRRRAGHRAGGAGVRRRRTRPDPAADAPDEPDAGRRLSLLRRALNHLDDESRDLLALHDVGEMPLSALAKLVAHDRKTVRSRLARARRRVSRWLCEDQAEPPVRRPRSADHARQLTVHARSGRARAAHRLRRERARDSARLARALQRRARQRHRLRLARPADRSRDRSRR